MAASFTDILSLFLSFLGIYGLVLYLRYLIPRCIIPSLSALLIETQQLLDRAEEINAISPESGYRAHLESSANQFAMMRMESNQARGTFQQLRLATRRGLTCKLCTLYFRLEAIKLSLELAIDKQQLAVAESANNTVVVPSPAAATATPANAVELPRSLPLPATMP